MRLVKRIFNTTAVRIVLYSIGLGIVVGLLRYNTVNPNLRIQDLITLTKGIIIEALPFVILGVIVSTIVELYVSHDWVLRHLPKNRVLSHIIVSFLGVFMPVCECGNIPVARRFLSKGFNVSHSITFLLSAPILNPITFVSTMQAFNLNPEVAYIRMAAAFIIAVSLGLIISIKRNQQEFLNPTFYDEHVCHVDHQGSKFKRGLDTFGTEFIESMKLMSIGALVAGISQSIIPRDAIVAVGQNPILSVFAMIALAFVISICSNVDAFFALAYSTTFTLGSILSFLVFGPLIDIKILSMMRSTYTTKFLITIALYVGLLSLLLGFTVNLIL